MKWSLNLGKYSGIKVQIHWTFLILIAWIVIANYMQGQGWVQTLMTIALVLTVFVCVVLHEFGHALTAKRFGIDTKDITLLPIGGVARLEKMPEEPKQEFLIAIAGPLVNVAIALMIMLALTLTSSIPDIETMDTFTLTIGNFLPILAGINIFIFLFNLIPAFPMDGGRIFRALLSFRMDRVKATGIAAKLGQIIAIGFAFVGLFFNPLLILIGIFVYLGAQSEARMTQSKTILKGHTVRDVMMNKLSTLNIDDPLDVAVQKLLNGQESEFLVTANGSVAGVITRKELIKGLSQNGKEAPVKDFMDINFEELLSDMDVTEAYQKMQVKGYSILPVIDRNGDLVGSIDMENISEFIMIHSALEKFEGG